MGDERNNWRLKVLRFFQGQSPRPIKVEPRHRISGPRQSPSDWYDKPEMVLPQCNLCHERPLPGQDEPLVRGICGPCRKILGERPDAA
jgi:hypothetical protein